MKLQCLFRRLAESDTNSNKQLKFMLVYVYPCTGRRSHSTRARFTCAATTTALFALAERINTRAACAASAAAPNPCDRTAPLGLCKIMRCGRVRASVRSGAAQAATMHDWSSYTRMSASIGHFRAAREQMIARRTIGRSQAKQY